MSIVEDIENTISELDEIIDSDFSDPDYYCNTFEIRDKITVAIARVQKAYNVIQMALRMLKEFPDHDSELIQKLGVDLMGDYTLAKPFYRADAVRPYGSDKYEWKIVQLSTPVMGLKILSQFLLDSLSFQCQSSDLASRLYSVYRSYVMIKGPIALLKSRLQWTVMYPDSFTKDSIRIKNVLVKYNMEDVWFLFQNGIDNYRQGHLIESANGFSNALTAIMKAISHRYGYSGGQLGEHTMFLEKIGYIHQNIREMISRFFSYLAKFRKGQKASVDEARLLVDLSFSLFGFLVPRMSRFKIDAEEAKTAKKKVKMYVKEQKEKDARKVVAKAEKKNVQTQDDS